MSARSSTPRTDLPVTADQLLDDARRTLRRLAPAQAHEALRDGAVLVDIRSDLQRGRDGVVPCARYVPRNVLEWRCDPASPHRDPDVARRDVLLVLMCNEGYQSSLAAATLQRLGLSLATDVIGGFQAWRDAGLPVAKPGSGIRDAWRRVRTVRRPTSQSAPRTRA